ncbi:hypothetical protein WN51_09340 [Melipona quadrifasciata]|uniref:Uncharacterized protein n=1 Tax=Melipona quadrifasciata TaxID=166423 RepID=A0A0M9A5J8_9HYME|nr:hypothetical protein WN51_09340 [Melipona quadrifasciata]
METPRLYFTTSRRKKNKAQYQTTPFLLEVYATLPRESRDPNQPIANFRCISVAPEGARFSGLPPLKSLSAITMHRISHNARYPLKELNIANKIVQQALKSGKEEISVSRIMIDLESLRIGIIVNPQSGHFGQREMSFSLKRVCIRYLEYQ